MPLNRVNPQPQDDGNVEQNKNSENVNGENVNDDPFESDTQKIIHRHLQNKDDIITDEDIASVRVGVTPQFDEATEARFEEDEATEDAEEDALEGTEEREKEESSGEEKLTPWDTVDPS